MSLLFLDIDGVLNRGDGQGLESDKVALFQRIVQTTGCDVVLSSEWRKTDHQLKRVHKMLRAIGHRLRGTTPTIPHEPWEKPERMEEIALWIAQNHVPPHEPLVILDDAHDMNAMAEYHVRTESHVGLTEEHVREVIRRLGALANA